MNRFVLGVSVVAAAVLTTGCSDDDDDAGFSAGSAGGIFYGEYFEPEIENEGAGTTVVAENGRTVAILNNFIYFGQTSAPNPTIDEEVTSDSALLPLSGNYRAYDYMLPFELGERVATSSLRQEDIDNDPDYCYFGPATIGDPKSWLYAEWDIIEDSDPVVVTSKSYCADIDNDGVGGEGELDADTGADGTANDDYTIFDIDDIEGETWYIDPAGEEIAVAFDDNGNFDIDFTGPEDAGDCTISARLSPVDDDFNAYNVSGNISCDEGSVSLNNGLAWIQGSGFGDYGHSLWIAFELSIPNEGNFATAMELAQHPDP